MSLTKVLSSLETAIRKKYPSRLADLQKPSTKRSLTALQKAVGFSLPDEVLELYRWRGSADGFLTLEDIGEDEDGWDWCSADTVLQEHRLWSKLKPKAWQSSWLPLFSNGAGDSICVDASSGRLLALYHEDADSCEEVAEGLEEALKGVLARVKSGTWRGAPESKQVLSIVAKLKKRGANFNDIFGNAVFRLLERDPRAVLTVLSAAEKSQRGGHLIHDYRARAHLLLKDAESAHEAFGQYLAAIRESGVLYNPPFLEISDGFEKLKKKEWADQVAEIDALHDTYYLGFWLNAVTESTKSEQKASLRELVEGIDDQLTASTVEEEIQGWMDSGLSEEDARKRVARNGVSEAPKGPDLARLLAVKAAVLARLSKKSDSTKTWRLATKAHAKTAAFWKTHPLLC